VTTQIDMFADQYVALAEFRRQIRQFLFFSEQTARDYGIETQQHQVLLAVRGLPAGVKPTIREISSRLCIQHHSAVELINRMESAGTVQRHQASEDKREVLIRLTAAGRAILRKLALAHRTELERSGPKLAKALNVVLRESRKVVAA
jgi:DNA-binding MarR family transcriptional regulator